MIKFYKTKSNIKTARTYQVCNPFFKESTDSCKNYKNYLPPFIKMQENDK